MKTRLLRVWCRRILLVGALAMLTSCDGGIFGTGDGGIDSSADNVDAGSSDLQPPAGTETPPTDDVDEPSPDAQPGDPDDDTQVEVRSFENLQIGSNSTRPLIALVNLSAVPLNATTTGADVLFSDAILPGVVSDYASVALESTQLSVIDSATADPLLILSPLNLGAFSVSALIARDRLTTDASEQNNPGPLPDVEIIAIASQQLPSDDGVARVRLLQASLLDDDDEPASMSLVPAGESPGGSEVDLGIVSAADFGTSTEYRLVTPGSYALVDSLGRLTLLSVELAGGEFHTLILTGSPVELLVMRDSQSVDQGAPAAEQP